MWQSCDKITFDVCYYERRKKSLVTRMLDYRRRRHRWQKLYPRDKLLPWQPASLYHHCCAGCPVAPLLCYIVVDDAATIASLVLSHYLCVFVSTLYGTRGMDSRGEGRWGEGYEEGQDSGGGGCSNLNTLLIPIFILLVLQTNCSTILIIIQIINTLRLSSCN